MKVVLCVHEWWRFMEADENACKRGFLDVALYPPITAFVHECDKIEDRYADVMEVRFKYTGYKTTNEIPIFEYGG